MTDAIDNYQPSLAITEYVPLSGFYPSTGNGFGFLTLGMVRQFAGDFGPSGAPAAEGQLISISSNTALFSLFGTAFGGNGITTFGLPGLQGRSAVGDGQGSGLAHDHALGSVSGAASPTLTQAQLSPEIGGTFQPFDNEQPSQAFTYLIRVNGNLPDSSSDMFIGEVVKFGANFVPAGYLEANGQILTILDNQALFSVIGTRFGGDGINTFALPDLRGRTAVGATGATAVGIKTGSETTTFTFEQMPEGAGGLGDPFSNLGPGLSLNYIIKVAGSFPSASGSGGAPDSEHWLGEITLFAGSVPPPGWALCDGAVIAISSNTALFSLLGDTFGGNGTSTFALPDFRDRAALGASDALPVGSVVGTPTASLDLDTIPAIDATGTADGELFFGGNLIDWLKGLGGDDTLIGNGGADKLDGGTGADTMAGGSGNDTYYVDDFNDEIIEVAGGGTLDTVRSTVTFYLAADSEIERMVGSAGTSPIKLRGNAFAQEITGNKGDNSLSDGGAGKADTLIGLSGNDLYRVYNSADIIVEIKGQGTADRVQAAVSFTLAADDDIEILQTTSAAGTSTIALYGNDLAQTISGNAGSNSLRGYGGDDTISGGAGNDRISGGLGNDTLAGNTGADTYYFSYALDAATNVDTIKGFSGIDRISLSASIFTKAGPVGNLAATAFVANDSGAAEDAGDRIVYETDTGILSYDADGTGAGAAVIFAIIDGTPAINAGDFVVG